jgi:phosphoglycolate phosphatase
VSVTTLLFDLDGTLLETSLGILNTIRHTLNMLALPNKSETELRQYIGPPLREVFAELAGEFLADEAVDIYRQRYNAVGKLEAKHYPTMLETIEHLHQHYQLIIATSKRKHFADDMVTHFSFAPFFRAIYGSPIRPETKSELIQRILADTALEPTRTVMIGDRSFDMIGARDNHLRSVGVLWGYGSEEELLQSGASVLCKKPQDLVKVLEAL